MNFNPLFFTLISLAFSFLCASSQPLTGIRLTKESQAILNEFKLISDEWCGSDYLNTDTIDDVYDCFRTSRGDRVSIK